jgi:hypothetical protein
MTAAAPTTAVVAMKLRRAGDDDVADMITILGLRLASGRDRHTNLGSGKKKCTLVLVNRC